MGSNATKMVIADFLVSCLWVISGALVRVATAYIASHVLQHTSNGEILRWVLQVLTMFIFAWVGKLTDGSTYNPLTLVLNSVASSKSQSYFTLLLARILAQAFGSLVGVIYVTHVMPHGGLGGPMLKVGLKSGMLTEAILTFVIAMVGLITNARGPKGFFLKTWIMSLSKLSLSILGADFTGPAMNPATAFGWAYTRDQLVSKEHVFVYWLAPLEACILAVLIFQLFVVSPKKEGTKQKTKNIKKD